MEQPILIEMRNISKSFGPVKALDMVNFSCRKGEIHVLVGENGAGKSTMLKIISGIFPPDSGTIHIDGTPICFRNPQDAQRAGIGMVFQELTLLPELTVSQNIFLHHEPLNRLGLIDGKAMRRQLEELMSTYQITVDAEELVGDLSLDKKQLVEILKVLFKNPNLIILDEPTSALNTEEVSKLHSVIKMLQQDGKTVIYISHRLSEVFSIGHRATVLKDGRYVTTCEISETSPHELVRLMVGRPLQNIFPPKCSRTTIERVFEVSHLSVAQKLHDISFYACRGEIVGIAGLQGHGQTELLNCIAGLRKIEKGNISIKSRDVRIRSSKGAIRAGIAFIPEDRKTQGLLLNLPIRQNISLASLYLLQFMGFIRTRKEGALVRHMIQTLSIKTANTSQLARELSGGNQQKVVLAKGLSSSPRVVVFSEPTRGIDVEAKHDFYKLMRKYAEDGIVVILYSSDLMELIGMSDKVIVLYEGRITGVLDGENLNEESIMRCAVGI